MPKEKRQQQTGEDARLVRDVLSASTARRARVLVPAAPDEAESLWRSSRAWLRFPAVTGLEVGRRTRRGRLLGEIVLRVLVERKVPPQDPERAIPAQLPVPGSRRTVSTDIEAIGDGGLDADERFSIRRRPSEAGTAIRLHRWPPATFACILRDTSDGRQFLLSNAHVIAKHGHAPDGLTVYQPMASRKHKDADIAAYRFSISVRTSARGFENLADAAIAEITDPSRVSAEVYSRGKIEGIAANEPTQGDRVQKFGPGSGHTTSEITAAGATVAVRWRSSKGRTTRAGFKGAVRCTPAFTTGGDSGAAVLSPTNRLLGLHFASFMGSSYFIPITTVLSEFKREHELELALVTDT